MDAATVVQVVLAVGPLLPLLVAVVQQPQWSPRVRSIASVIVSVIAGSITYVADSGLDFSNPPAIVAVIVGTILASNVAYKTIWQPTGLAPAIENSTIFTNPLTKPKGLAPVIENSTNPLTQPKRAIDDDDTEVRGETLDF